MATAPAPLSPLPPVEQVRPGLWSIPVPIPKNPLRYVFVYAFETDGGTYIVDAGWNTDESWDTLCAGLQQAGTDVQSVRGVLVTHIHPDHYGLAARVREASGAWVALHPEDAALIQDRYIDTDDLLRRMAASLQWMGAPPDEIDGLAHASMPVKHFVTTVRPDILIEDGD
ncbi:MAG: MBL fold metallo-hydrolase, partial [Acidimicrobiia bacterium]